MSSPEKPTASMPATPPGRNGLLTFNVLWGLVGLIVGYAIGLWIGHRMGSRFDWTADIDYNDIAVLLGYSLGTIGYLAGLGILNHPVARLFGRSGGDVALRTGWGRYARASTDHKVQLADALAQLAGRERYLALQVKGRRYDIGGKYGLLLAQLALVLDGTERDEMLAQLVELLANRQQRM